MDAPLQGPQETWPISWHIQRAAGKKTALRKIPKRLRAMLGTLLAQRAELRRFPKSGTQAHCGDWHYAARIVYEQLRDIEDSLRAQAGADMHSCVEYYSGYRFRCVDAQAATAAFVANGGKLIETPADKVGKPVPGRTWEADEQGRLCFHIIDSGNICPCMPATLADVIGRVGKRKGAP